MLRESNNVIAENLARQVALREGRPASFGGAAAAVTAVLRRLGVPGGIRLVDGSGLSPRDRIARLSWPTWSAWPRRAPRGACGPLSPACRSPDSPAR